MLGKLAVEILYTVTSSRHLVQSKNLNISVLIESLSFLLNIQDHVFCVSMNIFQSCCKRSWIRLALGEIKKIGTGGGVVAGNELWRWVCSLMKNRMKASLTRLDVFVVLFVSLETGLLWLFVSSDVWTIVWEPGYCLNDVYLLQRGLIYYEGNLSTVTVWSWQRLTVWRSGWHLKQWNCCHSIAEVSWLLSLSRTTSQVNCHWKTTQTVNGPTTDIKVALVLVVTVSMGVWVAKWFVHCLSWQSSLVQIRPEAPQSPNHRHG